MDSAESIDLSWVLPVYRTQNVLAQLLARIDATAAELGANHEVIIVNDACPDGSGVIADAQAVAKPHIKVVHIEKNCGQDASLLRGLREATGEWVVIHDADLQDPPEAVCELWRCRHQAELIFAEKRGKYTSVRRSLSSKLYRFLLRKISTLPAGAGLYALMSKDVAHRIAACGWRRPLLVVAFSCLDVASISTPIERHRRTAGRSSYSSPMRLEKGLKTLGQIVIYRFLGTRL